MKFFIILLFFFEVALAQGAPELLPISTQSFLHFTDIDDGPSTGLGDGLGSGAIVTVWGSGLGASQGEGQVWFKDSIGGVKESSYIYTWDHADGDSDGSGGPANLYDSHKLQEVSFSIPASPNGVSEIFLEVNGKKTNSLPFFVRSGTIVYVSNSGSDTNSGIFSAPFATPGKNGAFNASDSASQIVYLIGDYNLVEDQGEPAIKISSRTSDIDNQSAIIAYPNSIATISSVLTSSPVEAWEQGANVVIGDYVYSYSLKNGLPDETNLYVAEAAGVTGNSRPIHTSGSMTDGGVIWETTSSRFAVQDYFKSDSFVTSKLKVSIGIFATPSSAYPVSLGASFSNTGLDPTNNGRIVGNLVTQAEGRCVTGKGGAIAGNNNSGQGIGNLKVFGNQIQNWGCDHTSRFAHTTYFTNRSGPDDWIDGASPTIAWNYLKNNKAIYGIHFYDETQTGTGAGTCGDFLGDLEINNNVIINQRGSGINIGAADRSVEGGNINGVQQPDDNEICWSMDVHIFNNYFHNVGQGPNNKSGNGVVPSGIRIQDSGYGGNAYIYNNTVINWSGLGLEDNEQAGAISHWSDLTGKGHIYVKANVFISDNEAKLFATQSSTESLSLISGENNIFLMPNAQNVLPFWAVESITTGASEYEHSGFNSISIGSTSAAIDPVNSSTINLPELKYDLFGRRRDNAQDLGAIEYSVKPEPPTNLGIVTN
jgi:hypothetical protein